MEDKTSLESLSEHRDILSFAKQELVRMKLPRLSEALELVWNAVERIEASAKA